MLRPRIIPCLLIHKGGLVKTVQFSEPKYVGDPLNAVRIFNEKGVDEIIILDIDASLLNREPDYKMISKLAGECRMPLCYGGGVKNPEQVERIISLGVEKVSISSSAIENPSLISECASRVGSQSIVVVLDIKKTGVLNKRYELYTYNGKRLTNVNPIDFARKVELVGAGEILLNSIDQDGTMKGYDFQIIDQLREAVTIPISVLGGGKNYADISLLIKRYGTIGIAAGSMFVFKGKYRAVLIQYPNQREKELIMTGY